MEPTIIRNKKYRKLPPVLRLLYAESIFYANLNETNGNLTMADLISIQALLGYSDIIGLSASLVEQHLWEIQERDGESIWHIHDYEIYQPTRDEQGRWHYPAAPHSVREQSKPAVPAGHRVDSRGLDPRLDPRVDPLDFDKLKQARHYA